VERIVANLLRFARQERTQRGRAAVNRILADILRQIDHQIPMTDIAVTVSLDPADPEVEGDGDQLQQVFTNLIINAAQAMPHGGSLTITTRVNPDEDSCEIVISDSGCGIAPENLEQIFNPFFTTRAKGIGLGLSVSYGIIRDHGGEIAVDSVVDKGTSFRITLRPLLPAGF
jgi:two-component system NtrC family sensor kinase